MLKITKRNMHKNMLKKALPTPQKIGGCFNKTQKLNRKLSFIATSRMESVAEWSNRPSKFSLKYGGIKNNITLHQNRTLNAYH